MTWARIAALVQPRHLSEAGTLGARVFGLLAGLISSGITAHALSPDDRGQYFYVVAIAGVLASFANLGLPSANSFFSARNLGWLRRLLWWSTILGAVMGVMLAAVFSVATLFPGLQRFAAEHELWLLALTPGVLALSLMGPLLAGAHRFGALNVIQVGQQAFLLICFAAIARWAPSAEAFLAAASVGALLGVAATMVCVWLEKTPPATEPLTASAWVRYGMRAYVVLLLGTLVSRLGVLFVRAYGDPVDLGIYSVSVQLWDAMAILPSSLAMILFPTIVRDQTLTWHKCVSESRRMLVFAVVAAIGAAVVLKPAIPLVFGQAYASAYWPSLFFLPGFVAFAVVNIASQFLAAIGFPRGVAISWAISAVFLTATAPVLVSRWGPSGGAAATSLTYCILALLMLRLAYNKLPKATDPTHV
jgi:O-antigen/teichoic acid export membrane protein